ncbi:MAG: hypothetical protein AAF471_03645 [Myxococcota bacterium]
MTGLPLSFFSSSDHLAPSCSGADPLAQVSVERTTRDRQSMGGLGSIGF